MRQTSTTFNIETPGRGLFEFTGRVAHWVAETDIREGLLTLFIRHTSASLTVQENADPDVVRDLDAFLSRLVPDDPALYRHTSEGVDDMPAHIRAALTLTSLSIPVADGRMVLGTWQGLYVLEHRFRPHSRRVAAHLLGE